MTSWQAMAELRESAVQLSIARRYAENHPSPEDLRYIALVKAKYDAAFRAYTDPMGSKRKEET